MDRKARKDVLSSFTAIAVNDNALKISFKEKRTNSLMVTRKYVKDYKGNVGTYTTDINEAKQLPGPREARLAADLLNVKINGYTFTPKFIGG